MSALQTVLRGIGRLGSADQVGRTANTPRIPRSAIMVAVIAVVWFGANFLSQGLFLTARNLSTLSVQISIEAVLATGMCMLLVAREIDLSVGSAVSVVNVVVSLLQVKYGFGTPQVIALGLVVGLLMGALEGFLVAFAGIPSFIVTLGGMLGFEGLGLVISNQNTIGPVNDSFLVIAGGYLPGGTSLGLIVLIACLYLIPAVRGEGPILPRLVSRLPIALLLVLVGWFSVTYLGLPYALMICATSIVAAQLLIKNTKLGRWTYAVGGNPAAARYAGISRGRLVFSLFLIMGLLYGIAGVMLTSRLDGAPTNAGLGLALDVISACIIGGVSLFGGVGDVKDATIGVVLFGSLTSGMDLLNIGSNAQLMLRGFILAGAAGIDVATKRQWWRRGSTEDG